jgi:DNA-binding transcriptional LysR family regulator
MTIAINLHQLKIFLAVNEHRSFSKAAAELGMTQPSISIQIKNLERDLGVHLFDRLRQNTRLTEEGQLVAVYAKQMLNWISSLESDLEDLRGIKVGNLVVGASRVPSSTTFPLAFALFKKQYPETNIVVKTALSRQVEQWVLDNEVDLAIVGGDVSSKFIVREHYYKEELLVVLTPQHRLARKDKLLPEDILSEPFLLPYTGRVAKFVDDALQRKGVVITNYVTLGSREAIKAALAAGFGITIMPRSAVELESNVGILTTKNIYGIDLQYPVYIIHHKDKHLSRLALTFLEFLRKLQSDSPVSKSLEPNGDIKRMKSSRFRRIPHSVERAGKSKKSS